MFIQTQETHGAESGCDVSRGPWSTVTCQRGPARGQHPARVGAGGGEAAARGSGALQQLCTCPRFHWDPKTALKILLIKGKEKKA